MVAPQGPAPQHDPHFAVYKMHSGAKTALNVVGVLCCLLIVAIPFGIWAFIAASRGRVEVRADGLVAYSLTTVAIKFAEVQRLGYLNRPVIARGIGGALARKKVGGDQAVLLGVQDSRGKTRHFCASMYENHGDLFQRVSYYTHRPVETLEQGAFGLKWPAGTAM